MTGEGASNTLAPDPITQQASPASRVHRGWRPVGLLVCALLLVAAIMLSLAVGSANLPFETVWKALTDSSGTIDELTIQTLRVPRTIIAVIVGAALAVAGATMQGLTRNPLADPGILGVNAGAGFAVVLGVAMLGVTRISEYLWFGFIGAAVAAAAVYLIASRGSQGATPVRLTLVGVALSAVLAGASQTLALLNPATFDRMRFWGVGSVADRPSGTIEAILPFIVVGLVIALSQGRAINALALGDDLARSIGSPVGLTRGLAVLSVTLLCGAATAAVGPIGFVGLMVPHAVRFVAGPDQRWILPFSLLVGPVLMLVADVIGRLVIWPAELQVGVVTAFVGAPVLIALVRRPRVSAP